MPACRLAQSRPCRSVGVAYAPGKASNAGGAPPGLEDGEPGCTPGPFEETDAKPHQIMVDIHATVATAEEYGGWETTWLARTWRASRSGRRDGCDGSDLIRFPSVPGARGVGHRRILAWICGLRSAKCLIRAPGEALNRLPWVCGHWGLALVPAHHDGEYPRRAAGQAAQQTAEPKGQPPPTCGADSERRAGCHQR